MLRLKKAHSCYDKDRVKGDGLCAVTRPLFSRRGFAFRGKIHCVPSRLVSTFCWQLSFISPFYTAVFSSSDCAAAAAILLLLLLLILLILIYLFIYLLTYLLAWYLLQ